MAAINYIPDPSSSVASSRCANGFWTSGSGAPTCAGFDRQLYIDTDTGDLYVRSGGTWLLVVAQGGGGGAGLTYHAGAGLDPNGVVTGSVGDVYHSRLISGGDGSTWWKVSGNGTDTGWE